MMGWMMKGLRAVFQQASLQQRAGFLYISLVEQARRPVFYQKYGVQDTLDGRFDMLLLHMAIISAFLRQEQQSMKQYERLSRYLQEMFIADMDRSLREMGVGDMSVGKKIKAMGEAWFGRRLAYEEALIAGDRELLKQAMARNLYRRPSEAEKASINGQNDNHLIPLVAYAIDSFKSIKGLLDACDRKEGDASRGWSWPAL